MSNQAGNLTNTKKFLENEELKTVGSDRLLLDEKLQITYQKPYDLLYNMPKKGVKIIMVDPRGFELLTSSVQMRRSTN